MVWKKFTSPPRSTMTDTVSLTIPDNFGRGSSPSLNIDLETLKKLGWKDGTTLQLLIGEAEHDGQIRIEPAAGEPARLAMPAAKGRRKRARVVLGRMPCLSEDGFRSTVAFEVVKREGVPLGSLVVTLPPQARAHRLPERTAAAVAVANGGKPK